MPFSNIAEVNPQASTIADVNPQATVVNPRGLVSLGGKTPILPPKPEPENKSIQTENKIIQNKAFGPERKGGRVQTTVAKGAGKSPPTAPQRQTEGKNTQCDSTKGKANTKVVTNGATLAAGSLFPQGLIPVPDPASPCSIVTPGIGLLCDFAVLGSSAP